MTGSPVERSPGAAPHDPRCGVSRVPASPTKWCDLPRSDRAPADGVHRSSNLPTGRSHQAPPRQAVGSRALSLRNRSNCAGSLDPSRSGDPAQKVDAGRALMGSGARSCVARCGPPPVLNPMVRSKPCPEAHSSTHSDPVIRRPLSSRGARSRPAGATPPRSRHRREQSAESNVTARPRDRNPRWPARPIRPSRKVTSGAPAPSADVHGGSSHARAVTHQPTILSPRRQSQSSRARNP